jgi:hypothetical protein
LPEPENVNTRVPESTKHDDAVVDTTEYDNAPSPDVDAAGSVTGESVLSSERLGFHVTVCEVREMVKVLSRDADAYVFV